MKFILRIFRYKTEPFFFYFPLSEFLMNLIKHAVYQYLCKK